MLNYIHRTQPQKSACQAMVDGRCSWTRGKILGGSSVLNTMLYIRGNKRDFDYWEEQGNPGWGYEDVLPYFRKSEDQRNPYLAVNKRQHGTGKASHHYFIGIYDLTAINIYRRILDSPRFPIQHTGRSGIPASGRRDGLRHCGRQRRTANWICILPIHDASGCPLQYLESFHSTSSAA